MEHKFMLTDDLLWDYADGFLSPEETRQVADFLQKHPEYQARLDQIHAEKRAFANLPLENADSGFAQQVMSAWAAEQQPAVATAKNKGNDWIFWAASSVIALLVFLPFLLPSKSAAPAKPLEIPEKWNPQWELPSYDWAGLFGNNTTYFLLLATLALLSLKLLDKYLQVRHLQTAA
ncbi:MAG TPA: hypothetical protein VK168_06655 [Saprospiraceae bacterium]|nr:hypothetical protein [Saprospiraceae bacterium]